MREWGRFISRSMSYNQKWMPQRKPPWGGVPQGGDPGKDPGHANETMPLSWPGNALGSDRMSWSKWIRVRAREVWAFLIRLLPLRPGRSGEPLDLGGWVCLLWKTWSWYCSLSCTPKRAGCKSGSAGEPNPLLHPKRISFKFKLACVWTELGFLF